MFGAILRRKFQTIGCVLAAGMAISGFVGERAEAATYTYDFSGTFGLSWSDSNQNGRTPIPGGTISGFFTISDDNPASWQLLDWQITTSQPLLGAPPRSTTYDHATRGVQPFSGSPLNAATATLPKYTAGGGALNIFNYIEEAFGGETWATAYQTLNITFLPTDLGKAILSLALGECYDDCYVDTSPTASQNTCGWLRSGQQYNAPALQR